MRYSYITIEGNIGAGKTSLVTRIANDFNGKLVLEQFADNPFLPLFYENRKQYAFPLELFFMAERFQQLKESMPSQDLFKKFTISDYMFIKSLLFASVNLKEAEYKLYHRLFQIIYSNLPKPELLVYLHCEVPGLIKNISKRGRKYEQSISAEYLTHIQETYFDYFKTLHSQRLLIIDVTKADFMVHTDQYEHILSLINKEYSPGTYFFSL